MEMLYWSSNDRLNLETDWASSDVVEATGWAETFQRESEGQR